MGEMRGIVQEFVAEVPIEIRACRERDLRQLEWFGLYRDHRTFFRQTFDRTQKNKAAMLVAVADEFPVGQVWIEFESKARASIAILWALRVLPGLRNRGLGTRLVRAAERVVAARGVNTVELGVEKHNLPAKRLYERLGYRCIGEAYEPYTYVTPDGYEVSAVTDQWVMHREVSVLRPALELLEET